MQKIKTLLHGRETYAVYYGNTFVMKRPLPDMSEESQNNWLVKQHKTKESIDAIRSVANPRYNVPQMHFINDEEYTVLEERAPGVPLTAELFRALPARQKYEIVNSMGAFLVDMNELRPIGQPAPHRISKDLKFARLSSFVHNKMSQWFTINEIRQMTRICNNVENFEFTTRMAWSHCDLTSGNIFYDPDTSKLSFIDFAESSYQLIYRDIFSPLQMELGIYKQVYEAYEKMHNKKLYSIPGPRNAALREIMKYRMIVVLLRRFIKASDDLRINPANQKSVANNVAKVEFMRTQMTKILALERQLSK